MHRWFVAWGSTLLLSVAVIACGGGGGGSSPIAGGGGGSTTVVPPSTGAPAGPIANATGGSATMSLTIPNATSGSSVRRARYISSATQSVAVFAYPAAATPPPTATTLVNVGAGQPNCTPSSAGTTCTLSVPAQYGSMTFLVKTYDGALGAGNLLSQATITQTIAPGANNVPLALSGIVAGTQLVVPAFSFPAGGGSFTLTVNALDANGAVIIGAGTYSTPISVTSSDSSLSISPGLVTGPGQTVTVTYAATAASGVTLRARAAGLSANAEGAVDVSFSQPAATNLVAYLYDGPSSFIFGFNAGANGVPGYLTRYTFPGGPGQQAQIAVSQIGTGAISFAPLFLGTTISTIPVGGGTLQALNTGGTYPPTAMTYDNSATSPTSGDLVVLHAAPTPGISYYKPPVNAAPVGGFTSTTLQAGISIGVDGNGNLYVLNYSPASVAIYPQGATAPTKTVPIQNGTLNAFAGQGFAVAPDGTFAVDVTTSTNPYTNTIRLYGPYGTWGLQSTLGGGIIAQSTNGAIALGPDDSLYVASGATVAVYPPNANGSPPPARSFLTTLANISNIQGIALGAPVAATTPSAGTLSGDFLAIAPNRTWNYSVTPAYGSRATVTVYADPQPVNGNLGLVAFVRPTSAPDALPANGGTLAAAGGFTNASDGYHAQTYGSVSNDSFGLIPGAPLIIPSTLTLGQTFVPFPGVTAVVRNIVSVPTGNAACPNPAATGASIFYSAGGSTQQIFVVPGCGITRFVNDAGTQFVLTSIGSHPELGQQTVARRVLNASYGDTLRSIWQALLVRH